MVTDDHFAIYTKIKSLCCIPEASIMLCVNYTSVIKKKENWAGSREQMKPKISKRKEIIKIRAEINKKESKRENQ